MNKKIIPIAVIVAGVIIAGAVIYVNNSKCPGSTEGGEVLSSKEVEEKVMNFINQNILQGRAVASLIETTEENGLYKIKFAIEGQEIESYATPNGELFFPEGINMAEFQPPAVQTNYTIGDFSVSEDEVCKENGKPVVYFFGSEGCPHCAWERPIIEGVVGKFKEVISFHNNTGVEQDSDVFQKYSTGGVPTLVLGCKYYRVGSGENSSEEEEEKVLTALICKLTDGNPADVCSQVEDLINQIED
jgi:thiol-disulfide isomerase/thioredoxin